MVEMADERLRVERLDDERIAARALALLDIRRRIAHGQENDRDILALGQFADFAAKLVDGRRDVAGDAAPPKQPRNQMTVFPDRCEDDRAAVVY